MIISKALIDTREMLSPAAGSFKRAPRTAPADSCPLCGDIESTLMFCAPDRLHGTPGEFAYQRCNGCRTVFQDPRVIQEDLAICYPHEYYTHEPDGQFSATPAGQLRIARDKLRQAIRDSVQNRPAPAMQRALGRLLGLSARLRERAFFHLVDELIPRWPDRLRALEVGCGAGGLLIKLDRAGWEVDGLEWDAVAAGVARRRSGCQVFEGGFSETNIPTDEYQLIVLSHVFEHLEDPLAALHRIKELLAPGGRAVLFYPNPDSAGARAFGDAWAHWDPPRHLVLPPLRSLAKAAKRLGLEPLTCRTRTGRSAARFARTGASEMRPPLEVSIAGRATAAVARILTSLGWRVGEEAIIVLQKCSDRNL